MKHTAQTLTDAYFHAVQTPSDINEHLPIIYDYARECSSIAELGVRYGISTLALCRGLFDNKKPTKKLIAVDIEKLVDYEFDSMIDYSFITANDLDIDIPNVDMLFIDTWHCYGQLKRELKKHSIKANKYIIMHDTMVDGIYSESLRQGLNIPEQIKQSGFSEEEIKEGLQKAIDEFLSEGDFELHKVFTNNNGLTILKRNTHAPNSN